MVDRRPVRQPRSPAARVSELPATAARVLLARPRRRRHRGRLSGQRRGGSTAAIPGFAPSPCPAGSHRTRHPVQGPCDHYAHELRAEDGEAKDDVWVPHMDDDTAVARTRPWRWPTLSTARPPRSRRRHLAQGVLASSLASSRPAGSLWLADPVRPGCDLSLLAATTGRRIAPDRFSRRAAALSGRRSGGDRWDFGPSRWWNTPSSRSSSARGIPARSDWFTGPLVRGGTGRPADFLRQRERWSWGLFTLVTDPDVPFRVVRSCCRWSPCGLLHRCSTRWSPSSSAVVLADASTGPVSPLIIPFWSAQHRLLRLALLGGFSKVMPVPRRRAQRTWSEPRPWSCCFPRSSGRRRASRGG